MEKLKEKLRRILYSIPSHSNIIFLDYRDLIIWKGTEKFFEQHHINITARYSKEHSPWDICIPNDHIIVFQGGGILEIYGLDISVLGKVL